MSADASAVPRASVSTTATGTASVSATGAAAPTVSTAGASTSAAVSHTEHGAAIQGEREARVTSTAHPRYLVIEATVQRAGKQLARSTSKIFKQPVPT